jgi:hypothetical protein
VTGPAFPDGCCAAAHPEDPTPCDGPHDVPLAVLLAGLLVIPEALAVGLMRLTWTIAAD